MSLGDIFGGMLYVAGTMAAQEMENGKSNREIEKINVALREEFGNKNIVDILNGYLSSSQKELLLKALEAHEICPAQTKDITNDIDAGWIADDIAKFDKKYYLYSNDPSYIASRMSHIPRYKIYERYNAYKKLGI